MPPFRISLFMLDYALNQLFNPFYHTPLQLIFPIRVTVYKSFIGIIGYVKIAIFANSFEQQIVVFLH